MADSTPSSPDRLSNLPEHILLHILSFLPTKTAVKASVLSKRWQHLWTLVPIIDLYDESLALRHDYVSKVLDCNKAPILRRFCLRGEQFSISDLDKWVSSVTKRSVEELELVFRWVYDDDLLNDFVPRHRSSPRTFTFRCPPESCKTLVVLKVMPRSSIHFIGDLQFPTLKILHTSSALFDTLDPSRSEFSRSLFPLLEELVVHLNEFLRDIDISLPMLRRLEIDCTFSDPKYTFNVDAPSLQYLGIIRFESSGELRVGNLHKLVEANVEVFYNEPDEEFVECLVNILNVLSNVRMLNLSLGMFRALHDSSFYFFFPAGKIQPFHNLVELDLQLDRSELLGTTMIMLSKFGNLEHLKIAKSRKDNMRECSLVLPTPTHVPNCLTCHLKTFCFRYFEGSKYRIEFTIYILKNSLVLEYVKMLFSPRVAWKKGNHYQAILSATSRGSLECQLEFDQETDEFEHGNDIDEYYFKRWVSDK